MIIAGEQKWEDKVSFNWLHSLKRKQLLGSVWYIHGIMDNSARLVCRAVVKPVRPLTKSDVLQPRLASANCNLYNHKSPSCILAQLKWVGGRFE